MILASPTKYKIFFLAEKCASTTIREALLSTGDWDHIQSIKPCDAEEVLTAKYGYAVGQGAWKNWTSYVVTRSPYARAVSYWAYRKSTGETDKTFEAFLFGQEFATFDSLNKWYGRMRIDHMYMLTLGQFTPLCLAGSKQPLPFEQEFGVVLPTLNASEHEVWQTHYDTQEKIAFVDAWAAEDFTRFKFGKLYKTYDAGKNKQAKG